MTAPNQPILPSKTLCIDGDQAIDDEDQTPDPAQDDFPYAEAKNHCPPSNLLKALFLHAGVTQPKLYNNPFGFDLRPLDKRK